jgi:hypothetical protein
VADLLGLMRALLRYAFVVLFALWWAWLAADSAHAYPATQSGGTGTWKYEMAGCSTGLPVSQCSPWYSTASAPCDLRAAAKGVNNGFPYSGIVSGSSTLPSNGGSVNGTVVDSGLICSIYWTQAGQLAEVVHIGAGWFIEPVTYSCQFGGAPDGSNQCVCPSGYTDNGSTCVVEETEQQKLCKSLKGTAEWTSTIGQPAFGATTCIEIGCQATWGPSVSYTNHVTGITETEGNVVYTGETCTYIAGQPVTSATPDKCHGGAYGQVNGVWTCVPYNPDTNTVSATTGPGTVTSSVTGSTPDGSSTSGTSTVASGPSTTTCDGGKCTTTKTVTTVNADGTTTTSTVTAEIPQQDFCKDNPRSPICITSQWGGSCAEGYTCSGDSATCAAAVAVAQQKCAFIDGPPGGSAEQSAYAAAVAASGTGIQATNITVSGANFDSSNALGVAPQCIGDLAVTVWGREQTIELSKVCPWIETLGTIMLALSWLGAAVIVGKGVSA